MYKKGEIIFDRETGDRLIVTKMMSDEASEVVCKQGFQIKQTVYDLNERYSYVSEDEPVVEVVYASKIQKVLNERDKDKEDKRDVEDDLCSEGRYSWYQDTNLTEYHFPISRLERRR